MLDGPEKFTYVSSLLCNEEKERLQCVLLRNIVHLESLGYDRNQLDAGLSQVE